MQPVQSFDMLSVYSEYSSEVEENKYVEIDMRACARESTTFSSEANNLNYFHCAKQHNTENSILPC